MKKPYPTNWRRSTLEKRLLAHVIVDPFVAAGHHFVQSFPTQAEAEAWLAKQQRADEEGFAGCYVTSREHALANFR